jgi:hypothetical protein
MMAIAELKQLTKDIRRAERRVGDRARWLLAFAYRDLSKLNRQGVADVGMEVLALAKTARSKKPFDAGDLTFPPYDDSMFSWYSQAGLFTNEPDQLLVAFQQEVKKRFDDCRRGEVWEFERPPFRQRFEVFTRVRNLPRIYLGYPVADQLESLLDAATTIVMNERERFAICANPRCGNPFVAERKRRAKYCQPKCAAYVNVNKKRGKL